MCVATGSYLLDDNTSTNDKFARIPADICLTPPPEQRDEAVRLGLSCSGGVVGIYWNTSLAAFRHTDNITLHTSCLNADDRLEEVSGPLCVKCSATILPTVPRPHSRPSLSERCSLPLMLGFLVVSQWAESPVTLSVHSMAGTLTPGQAEKRPSLQHSATWTSPQTVSHPWP